MSPFLSESDITPELVHRARQNDIFVTRFSSIADHSWRASIHIATEYERMPGPGLPLSTLIALEVVRQGLFLTFHHGLNLAMDWHFVTLDSSLMWITRPLLQNVPFLGVLEIDLTSLRECNGVPRQFQFVMRLGDRHEPVAVMTMNALALSAETYKMMRQRSWGSRSEYSKDSPLLSRDNEVAIRWDGDDKFLFRRASDHVVSMALIDALIGSATAQRPESDIRAIRTKFLHFANHDHPIFLNVEQKDFSFKGQFVQEAHVVSEGIIEWTSVR